MRLPTTIGCVALPGTFRQSFSNRSFNLTVPRATQITDPGVDFFADIMHVYNLLDVRPFKPYATSDPSAPGACTGYTYRLPFRKSCQS